MAITASKPKAPARRRGFDPGRRAAPERLTPPWVTPTAPAGWMPAEIRAAAWVAEAGFRRVRALPVSASVSDALAVAGPALDLIEVEENPGRAAIEDLLSIAASRLWAAACRREREIAKEAP